MDCLETLAQTCVGKNLFTYHNDYRGAGITMDLTFGRSTPFQIDANMGITAAVYEMLMHSKPNAIYLLPALPESIPAGRIRGLHTRAGVCVDMDWSEGGKRIEVTLSSNLDKELALVLPDVFGEHQGDTEYQNHSIEVALSANQPFRTILECQSGRFDQQILSTDA